MSLRNFDPDLVTAEWILVPGAGGATIDLTQGLIAGPNSIQETKDSPRSTRTVDRQGNAVRNISRNKAGMITFTYQAQSQTQDVLSPLVTTDDETGLITGTIVIKDLNGDTLLTYLGAYIEDEPNVGYGDTASDRPFVFGYAKRIQNLAGTDAL